MKAKITKIFLYKKHGTIDLRLDWNNDRHHSIQIENTGEKMDLINAFLRAATLIDRDKNLD